MAQTGRAALAEAEYLARNAVDCLPDGALAQRLAASSAEGRPLRVKLGIDPSSADIHLGHTVVLQKLREFQDRGHVAVLIVGDYTARVGDPSGRSATRPVLSADEIDANARTYQEQALRVLDSDPARLEVRRNGEWLDMDMAELFRLASTTTIAQLLERDDFAQRYASGAPISILELLYPLMQGYDSVAIEADLELGGTDQKFNLLLGRDIQRAYGQPEQVVMTLPLLVGTDGKTKMSKSLENHIGVTEAHEDIYGKVLSVPDEALASYFDLLLGSPPPEDVGPRDAKRLLARALVERYHGAAAAAAAETHFDRVFVEHRPPEELEETVFPASDTTVHLPALIADAFGISRSEARRLLAQGAVRVGDETVDGETQDVDAQRLDGAILQVGKRRFTRLRRG
jgi:tyrosyl-tRNA synthetase